MKIRHGKYIAMVVFGMLAVSSMFFFGYKVVFAASITRVQTASNTCSSGNCTVSISGTAAGDFLVVNVLYFDNNNESIPSVTDSHSDSFSTAFSVPNFGSHTSVGMFYLANTASGITSVTVNAPANAMDSAVMVSEYSGIATSNPFDAEIDPNSVASTAGSGYSSGSITTTNANDLLVGWTMNFEHYNVVDTGTSGWTTINNIYTPYNYYNLGNEERIVSSAGTYANVGTATFDGNYPAIAAFKASSSGGSGGDTTPPSTPTNLSASAISSSQINLTWTASTDNVGVTGYTIYRNGTQVGTSPTNSYSDTGLTSSTNYSYTISAQDGSGNTSSQSSSASATTQAQSSDTTPPSTPTNLSATALSSSSINLTWSASTDNVGVTGYKIYRGGVQIATSGTNSYSDTGLSASTNYSYTVSAYDAAGNNSSQSSSASATTQSGVVGAKTYYVDYANGNDANNGTSKSTPWKHAPGMNGTTGVAASITLNPGDSVILKGCVTWPNAAFSWYVSQSGSPGNPVYYGVDKTWWDNTVPGCASAWNRPVFNLGDANPTDPANRIIYIDYPVHDIILDDFEMTNMAANWNSINGFTSAIGWGSTGDSVVENMYIHGWNNPCISVGTGNLTAGSYTVTNYRPYSYSPSPGTDWGSGSNTACGHGVQLQAITGSIPIGNNSPTITSVTGSGPYSVTFTNTSGPASQNCTNCVIQLGSDWMNIVAGVNGPDTNHGDVMFGNVIDGSDVAEAQWNPYPDCGLSEGDNNMCLAGGTASWRQPNIWRDNVIRYVFSVAISTCTEWSGNLIEDLRGEGTDPTGHSNAIECQGVDNTYSNGAALFYNNVFLHLNNPNPNTPTGVRAIGLGNIRTELTTGETSYIFNNIMSDTLNNYVFEAENLGTSPHQYIFNNSVDCGVTALGLSEPCIGPNLPGDNYSNNYMVTSNTSPIGNCSGYTCQTNEVQTSAQATSAGYLANSTYVYSPPAGGATIGTGTNLSTVCATIGVASPAAEAACMSDTTYAVGYDSVHHTVILPGRSTTSRPSTGPWDIGAYQYSSSGSGGGGSPPPSVPLPGDLNQDHTVNSLDFSLLNSKWGQSYSAYDLYPDGIINSLDYAIMSSEWGQTW